MKYLRSILIASLCFTALHLWAQTPAEPQQHYIEVNGSAEMEIIPDEIYISVTLAERFDGRTKVTMAQQETKFIEGMKSLNIPMSDISLSTALADFSNYKWKKEDALATKQYIVLVHTAEMVSKVYTKLVENDAENAYIYKVSHSKIEDYRKEVKINAIKATHDKATYLLTAIGEEIGKPLVITEISNDFNTQAYSQYALSNSFSGGRDAESLDLSDIGFKKIKLRYEFYGKFEIK